jgi:hypothetical protein
VDFGIAIAADALPQQQAQCGAEDENDENRRGAQASGGAVFFTHARGV